MTLVSLALWLFDRLSKQESAFKGTLKGNSRWNVAFQKGDGRCAIDGPAISSWDAARNGKSNADNPIQMGNAGTVIEIQNWQRGTLQGDNFISPFHHSEFGVGVLAHDGSDNLFKWDHTKGCMVPFKLSNPITSESANI